MRKTKVPPTGTKEVRAGRAEVFSALKRVLRARKIGYSTVARRLGLSESGVKKIFATRNCSLERLESIAHVADIGLGDLFDAAENAPFEHVMLTEPQQRALLARPMLLAVFWKLSVERWTPPRIARELGLDDRALFRELSELDRLELIVLEQPGNRVRLRHGELVRWLPEGPLIDYLHEVWSREVLQRAKSGGLLRLSQVWLRPESYEQLSADIAQLLDGYARRGRADWLTGGERAVDAYGVLAAVGKGSFVPAKKPVGKRGRS